MIPDDQMVTKLATSVQAGDVPDLMSFDLIYMPDFMKAGFLNDLTDQLQGRPELRRRSSKAYKDLATYEEQDSTASASPPTCRSSSGTRSSSSKAGLDPEKPPTTIDEIHADAKKIRALGHDIYGFYFSGSCPGCNIFVTSPLMWARAVPRSCRTTATTRAARRARRCKEVLTELPRHVDGGPDPGRAPRPIPAPTSCPSSDRQDRHPGLRRLR